MSKRKYLCKHCGKIAEEENHSCVGQERAKQNQNAKRRDYYRKNKESLKLLSTKKWLNLRKRIIDRDDHLCKRCYLKFNIINGDQLQVHHIKPRVYYPELTFEESNLITLCKTCNIQMGLEGIDFEWEPPEAETFNL